MNNTKRFDKIKTFLKQHQLDDVYKVAAFLREPVITGFNKEGERILCFVPRDENSFDAMMTSLKANKDKMARLDQNSSSTAPEQIPIIFSVPNSEAIIKELKAL